MNFNFLGINKRNPTVVKPANVDRNAIVIKPANVHKKRAVLAKILLVIKGVDFNEDTPAQKAKFTKINAYSMSDQQVESVYKKLKECKELNEVLKK